VEVIGLAVAGGVVFLLLIWLAFRSARSGLPKRPESREARAIEEAGIDASRARAEAERNLAAAQAEMKRGAEEARRELEAESTRAKSDADAAFEESRDWAARRDCLQKFLDVLAAIRDTRR
jgi:hypothetical protein